MYMETNFKVNVEYVVRLVYGYNLTCFDSTFETFIYTFFEILTKRNCSRRFCLAAEITSSNPSKTCTISEDTCIRQNSNNKKIRNFC